MSIVKEKEVERESKNNSGQYYFAQQRKILMSLSLSFTIAIVLSFIFDLELKNLFKETYEVYCEDSVTIVIFLW